MRPPGPGSSGRGCGNGGKRGGGVDAFSAVSTARKPPLIVNHRSSRQKHCDRGLPRPVSSASSVTHLLGEPMIGGLRSTVTERATVACLPALSVATTVICRGPSGAFTELVGVVIVAEYA